MNSNPNCHLYLKRSASLPIAAAIVRLTKSFVALPALMLCFAPCMVRAGETVPPAAPAAQPAAMVVPDWSWPASATHKQVPPPVDFHRPTVNFATPIGIFEGQSDVGGPLLPGSASYDADKQQYKLNSASYNIWYTRDEMRFVWKKMSGDVSLAADITFPIERAPLDRKVVLVIRQDLDDDSAEVMAGLHAPGLIHLAYRPAKNASMKEACKVKAEMPAAGAAPIRIGIEKHGDTFALFVGEKGEPMKRVGATASLKLDQPFYVGIGFCSHVPDLVDTGAAAKVVLENSAGKVR